MPPAEPPAHDTSPGSALSRATSSAIDLQRRRGRNDDDFEFAGQTGDRRLWVSLTGALLAMMRTDHHHAGDHQGVALPLHVAEETRQADRAAGAGDILELNGLDDAGGLQHLSMVRPVWSQPPPGAAGMNSLRLSTV